MSDKIDDGGSAFPSPVGGSSFTGQDGYTTWQYPGSSGMSLRDYLACHVDQPGRAEIVQLLGWKPEAIDGKYWEDLWAELTLQEKLLAYARVRYLAADAMLAAREQA